MSCSRPSRHFVPLWHHWHPLGTVVAPFWRPLGRVGQRPVFTPHCRKATTTATTTLSSTSSTARVLRFLRLKTCQLRWVYGSTFETGHRDTNIVHHRASLHWTHPSILRPPRQLPQVALHESLVLDQRARVTTLQLLYYLYLSWVWVRKGLLLNTLC